MDVHTYSGLRREKKKEKEKKKTLFVFTLDCLESQTKSYI